MRVAQDTRPATGVFRPCPDGSAETHDVLVSMNPEIVVGVDDSGASREALCWAADQSLLTGHPLRVLHTWRTNTPVAAPTGTTDYALAWAADARARVTHWVLEALGDDAARYPWTLEIVQGAAGPALVSASRTAAMLVLGTSEHTGPRPAEHGSVGRYCLVHAVPPVVAVPSRCENATI
jgi:nucleotide-binding universal stress UspA family protein